MSLIAEATHELGRAGALEAKSVLERVLPGSIDLPFNSYDRPEALQFEDGPQFGGEEGRFFLDLAGVLKRRGSAKFGGQEARDVFVEVKSRADGGNVLGEYRDFLRRAAVVSLTPRYRAAWFVFYCTVPFGSTFGTQLADGTLLRECANSWPKSLQVVSTDLDARVVLVISTKSFVKMLNEWGRDA
jgi:hypothetical protein